MASPLRDVEVMLVRLLVVSLGLLFVADHVPVLESDCGPTQVISTLFEFVLGLCMSVAEQLCPSLCRVRLVS